ncbi:uncharacterized protein LOC142814528 isoform X2 [Rhipicephalus microplus]|uniref:uncharacterized protein LOC142814528 isoform X2 n=1 Tax=Rhipicephalus microplus TaxID=6941 RepID=UPI002376891B
MSLSLQSGTPETMKSILILIVLTFTFGKCRCFESDCNATLPWNVSKEDHPDIPSERFEELLRCPDELHGCSASRVNCTEELFALTCSCTANCERYGDCCWDAGASFSSPTASTCIARNVDKYSRREFYVVSGCDPEWPADDVRSSCENATQLKDPFYHIPVTTERQLTYFNAFCALCNYDLDNTSTFWNSSGSAGRDLVVAPPQYTIDNSEVFFWPCDDGLIEVGTCPEGTDQETKRKCLTYFAPVRYETNETEVVYKNVYCGLCNGAELSLMKCLPKQVVREIWPRIQLRTRLRPNLLSLIRPVVSQGSCFSWHNGKCYIRAPQYHHANASTPTVENETMVNVTNVTSSEHEPYNVQNYLTIICISLSLVCLFLKGVVYVLYRTSRTFSSKCTLCLSATLFFSHLLFLLGNSFDVSKPVCAGFAVVLHYGFLSTFFWTSVLSYDIWKNVAAVRLTSSRHGGFLVYALVAWGGPLFVIALCLALNWTVPEFVLSPQYGRFACWIGSLWSQLTFFLMPMVILLLLDIGLYVHIVVQIRNTAKRAAAFDFKGGGNRSHMALFVKLAFIMGTTWLLGFVGAFVNVLALDIIVIVLIGLQGVYLFFGFKDYEHLLPRRLRKKQRTAATGASTAHTELSSSGKDFSSREDVNRSAVVRSSEKLN